MPPPRLFWQEELAKKRGGARRDDPVFFKPSFTAHKPSSHGVNRHPSAAHTAAPQAVFKVIHLHGDTSGGVLRYLALAKDDAGKLTDEFRGEVFKDGLPITSPESLERAIELWDDRIADMQGNRFGAHLIFSAQCEPTTQNAHKVYDAMFEVVEERFSSQGWQTVVAIHKDTEHMHAHAVVLSENVQTGYKLRLNRQDIKQMRATFARELTVRGLPHMATPAKQKSQTQRLEKRPALARTLGEGANRDAVIATLRQAKAGDATAKAVLVNLRNNPASAKELPKVLPQPSPVVDQKRLTKLHRVFGDVGQAVAKRELEVIAKYEALDQGQLLKWQQGRLKQAQERIKKMETQPDKMRAWVSKEGRKVMERGAGRGRGR